MDAAHAEGEGRETAAVDGLAVGGGAEAVWILIFVNEEFLEYRVRSLPGQDDLDLCFS